MCSGQSALIFSNFFYFLYRNIKFNYCILDEGHVIKNGKTKLSKAIKQLAANFRVILSGTPIQVSWCLSCGTDVSSDNVLLSMLVCHSLNILPFSPPPEQCPGTLVIVRLSHAGLPRNRAAVCCSLWKTNPGQSRCQEFLPRTGGRCVSYVFISN